MTSSDRGKFAESIAKGYGKKDGEEPADDAKGEAMGDDDETSEAACGTELADALKGGDGAEIMAALRACVEMIKGE